MNAPQKAKLSMYNAVVSYCEENSTIIDALPAFKVSCASFAATVSLIAGNAQQGMQSLTGIAIDKRAMRKTLALQAGKLAAKIYAYANTSGLNELRLIVNYTVSEMEKLNDLDFPVVCRIISKAASDNLTALTTTYSITAADISSFNDAITAYEALEANPRKAIQQRSFVVTTLKELFQKADTILKNEMDKMVSNFIDTNPAFYGTYFNYRALVDPRTTATQLKGVIKSKVTGEPVIGALIEIAGNAQKISTTEEGKYIVKPIVPGDLSLTISKTGYLPHTVTANVRLGQINHVNILLVPAAE